MMHSSPKPLKVALDISRRLQGELAARLTPEQRRDFSRIEKLIEEAEKNHVIEVTRLHQKANRANVPPATTAPQPAKKRFWM